MGATSVTGVSGAGTVAGHQKGSEHMSLSVKKLIGPHIVAAGKESATGTTAVVEVPAQADAIGNYGVFLTNNSANTATFVSSALATHTSGWKFTITKGSSDVVHWMVVRLGL